MFDYRSWWRLFVLSAFFVSAPDGVSAQGADDAWVVVPVSVEPREASAIAARVRASMAASGHAALDAEATSQLFERSHSSDPTPIDANDIERWASRSRDALHHLSRGDYESARRALLEAQAISDRAAEALNRETMRARQVLDTCLFVVRASLETGDANGAREQARRCRRLVPRMRATTYTHTPEVRELLARVDVELQAEVAGSLTIESSPSGCNVRINGVYFGPTPLETSELPQGEYRVQVECDDVSAGRVHRVTLAERDVSLRVDAAFESFVRARPQLALRYADASSVEARADRDGAAVARALGRPVLLARSTRTGLSLAAFDANGDPLGTTTLERNASSANRDLSRLLGRPSEQHSPPVADASVEGGGSEGPLALEEPALPRQRAGRWAIGAGTLGGTSLAGAIAIAGLRRARGEAFDSADPTTPDYLAAQQRFVSLRAPLVVALGVGMVGVSAGGAMVLRTARHRSAFAWTLGGVGLALTTGSIVSLVRAEPCLGDPVCVRYERRVDRSVVLGGLAATTFTIPLAALVGGTDDDLVATLIVDRGLARLSVGGRWH